MRTSTRPVIHSLLVRYSSLITHGGSCISDISCTVITHGQYQHTPHHARRIIRYSLASITACGLPADHSVLTRASSHVRLKRSSLAVSRLSTGKLFSHKALLLGSFPSLPQSGFSPSNPQYPSRSIEIVNGRPFIALVLPRRPLPCADKSPNATPRAGTRGPARPISINPSPPAQTKLSEEN